MNTRLNEIDVKYFRNFAAENVPKDACNSSAVAEIFKVKAVAEYRYHDKDGRLIVAIPVTKNDCKQGD